MEKLQKFGIDEILRGHLFSITTYSIVPIRLLASSRMSCSLVCLRYSPKDRRNVEGLAQLPHGMGF